MNVVFLLIGILIGIVAATAVALWLRHRSRDALNTLAKEQLAATFKAVASDVLNSNSQAFLTLAAQNLGKFQSEAKGELEKRQQAVAELVKPIGEALKKTEEQIHAIEKERKQSFGSITNHLQLMAQSQQQLQAETRNLVNALRRPEVRGRWGELTLKRLAELAGMVERCDFYEQETQQHPDGRQRPDMVVRLPDNRTLVVDAKTPLDSYLAAIEAGSETQRETHLVQHARKVRERIKELASKKYWGQFTNSPDFVILFIPGDQFLAAALDREPGLIEEALRQKVMLATPTSFVALLKAVAYGWRQVALAENAEAIRNLAESLHQRLATFAEHLEHMGRSLGQSVEHYNKAVGSLERQVLPAARRFTEMGVSTKKEIPALDPLEITPRLGGGNGDDPSK